MADGSSSEPLLLQGGPPPADPETHIAHYPDVSSLYEQHTNDLSSYLQSRGVVRLGEFPAPDYLVLPTFEKDPIITLGASTPNVHAEQVWGPELARRAKAGPGKGFSSEVCLEAFVVAIKGAARPGQEGLLQPLLKRWQAGRYGLAVFGLPAVQAVIDWKWRSHCRGLLLWELAFFFAWLLGFNIFAITFQDEDLSLSLWQLVQTPSGKMTLAAQLVALVGMAPFLLLEVGTLLVYGTGWLQAENYIDMVTLLLQVGVTALHLGRWGLESPWMTVMPAVQLILLVVRLQYFMQAFRQSGFAFMDTVHTVICDLGYMLAFMIFLMWGFGGAFFILFRRDHEDNEDYATILRSFAAMFQHQAGLELKPMYESKSPYAATIMALGYSFFMGMILVNLLIAVIYASLDRATENAGTKLLLSQAKIIVELETITPKWLERCYPEWFPEYIHVLRINPAKSDQVADSKDPWAKAEGADLDDEGCQNSGGGGKAAGVEVKLAKMERQLEEQGALLYVQRALLTEQGALLKELVQRLGRGK